MTCILFFEDMLKAETQYVRFVQDNNISVIRYQMSKETMGYVENTYLHSYSLLLQNETFQYPK